MAEPARDRPARPRPLGAPTRSRSTGATSHYDAAARARRGRRRRDRRAARPRLAQPRRPRRAAGRPRAATTAQLRARAAAAALGAAPGRGRRVASRSPRCASPATPTGAGWPAAARRGWRRGPGAGRSAPAARSTSARARSTRSTRELDEEWSVAPERVRGEALVRLPHRLVMFIGQAWLPEGADGHARPRARRLRVVAGDDRRLAARGRRAAAAAWPACWRLSAEPVLRHAQAAVVHPLGDLPDPARGLDRPGPARARVRLRPGPRPRLDRDVRPDLAAVRARVIPLRLAVAVAVHRRGRPVRRLLRVRARGAPPARDARAVTA